MADLKNPKNRHTILMNENLMMLEEITNEIRARKESITNPHWGDVGDASHYHEKLKEIRDQLLKLGEFA